jgi:hypothetical protein
VLTSRKRCAGSNLVDRGRVQCAAAVESAVADFASGR